MTALADRSVSVSVLLYHSVADTTKEGLRDLTVEPGHFSDHIDALNEAGCSFVCFRDIPAVLSGDSAPTGEPSGPIVAITIDDGFADVTTGAVPALSKHGVPATLFVPTAYVGATADWLPGEDGERPLCDWQTLRDLAASGWEVASHGHRHIAADLSAPAMVTADAVCSRSLLEGHLGVPVTSFAYPFGYHSKEARSAIREAGFDQACVVSGLRARSGDDRWTLPRVQVGPDLTPEDLVALVQRRGGDARWRRRGKQRLWQLGRRWLAWGPPEAAAGGVADRRSEPINDGVSGV
jgi:peptidoglycan/xylan/chitin deacetylase (PgdA/CDA1 family)